MSFERDFLKGFEPTSDSARRSNSNVPCIPKNLKFEDIASPATASNYRRLRRSRRVSSVGKILERRGIDARTFELMLRMIAVTPDHWWEANETFKQAQKRRARLSGKLRCLADELRNDREANLLSFSPSLAAYAEIPDDGEVMLTFADLMDIEAASLEVSDRAKMQLGDGSIATAREFDRLRRPLRSVPLRTYALKRVFELLKPHFQRAPNKEAQTIASVLLQERINPGAVTHLRRKERRKYGRDK